MSQQAPKRSALGRGLGALIPGAREGRESTLVPALPATASAHGLRILAIEALRPGAEQPRKRFDADRLRELADSIRHHGILQPIVVAPIVGEPGEYTIIAGERRWRAAQLAGLHEVPAIIRDAPESERLELAMIENLQRQDLDAIEEAQALRQLMDIKGYTQEQVAERIGKDRSTVANTLRLLGLPLRLQGMVHDGRLGMGHARALLGLDDLTAMSELADQVIRDALSVRAVERAVRQRLRDQEADPAAPEPGSDAERHTIIVRELEVRLRRALGAKVSLRERSQKAGTIEIPYSSLDDLDRLLRLLLVHEPD
ncbi:MAG: ParB/RepB/Spo0J family partition protein [Nannocystis sp.]|nr:ParB/RepB/Spo0J family partition protein [Nannocystis sp.]